MSPNIWSLAADQLRASVHGEASAAVSLERFFAACDEEKEDPFIVLDAVQSDLQQIWKEDGGVALG